MVLPTTMDTKVKSMNREHNTKGPPPGRKIRVLSQHEDIQTLTKLGLTVLQARVYLTLAKSGKATIKTLSKASEIDRSDAYRVVSKLHELGLVEKMITTPNIFKAVPIREGLLMLLRRKAEEYNEMEAKTRELLQKYEKNNEEKTLQRDESQFILVPEKEASRRKFTNAIVNTQTSIDMILQWECFRYGMIEDTETWKKNRRERRKGPIHRIQT
jgi:sugar-specific transcriptional regulator TrmB